MPGIALMKRNYQLLSLLTLDRNSDGNAFKDKKQEKSKEKRLHNKYQYLEISSKSWRGKWHTNKKSFPKNYEQKKVLLAKVWLTRLHHSLNWQAWKITFRKLKRISHLDMKLDKLENVGKVRFITLLLIMLVIREH